MNVWETSGLFYSLSGLNSQLLHNKIYCLCERLVLIFSPKVSYITPCRIKPKSVFSEQMLICNVQHIFFLDTTLISLCGVCFAF